MYHTIWGDLDPIKHEIPRLFKFEIRFKDTIFDMQNSNMFWDQLVEF